MALGETSSSNKWNHDNQQIILSYPACGASLAAPIVAAAAAQISQKNPHLNAKQIRKAILSSARKTYLNSKEPLPDAFGQGVLNTKGAHECVKLLYPPRIQQYQ